MPKMKSNFRGLVTLLAKNLYPEPDVFVRELIQNAHDSIQLRRVQTRDHTGRIHVTIEPSSRCITFSDDGLGMNRYVIEEFLSTIGSSGTGTMTTGLKQGAQIDVATIGQFGIGLLSAFVVAERVDVYTRHVESGETWHWVNTGDDEYSLSPTTEMSDFGTQVIVTVKPEYNEFLQEETIESTIRKYADLLGVPIFLNGRGPINAVRPPWEMAAALPPSERENYITTFLSHRYPDLPLLIIPVNLPQLQTQGILYITDQHIPGINTSGFVDLYQNRMCLRPRDVDLLPDWARFVRGLVDSRILQPTAARDNVRRNEDYCALRHALGELIIEAIIQASKKRPEFFANLCRWHHFHFKGMGLVDDHFFDSLVLRLPFETSEGEMTLEQYRQRQGRRPDQSTPIYYFGNGADATRFYEITRTRGILALNAGKYFEEGLLRKLLQRQPGAWTLRRLDHLDTEDLYQRLPAEQEEAFQPLLSAVTDVLREAQRTDVHVGIRHFEPKHVCAVLLEARPDENVDNVRALLNHPCLMSGLEALRAEIANSLDSRPQELLLNAANPLVQQLSRLGSFEDVASQLALRGLYFAALLHSKGRLSSENSNAIYRHLLEALDNMLSSHSALSTCRRQTEALRKVVEERNSSLDGAEWIDAATALYGKPPAVFRETIAKATNEEVARILVDLLTMKHPETVTETTQPIP